MNKELLDELKNLQEKIQYNQADIKDYERYEQILLLGGFTSEHIKKGLQDKGISSWSKFLYERNIAKSDKDIQEINKALGWILGVGLAIILFWAITKE